MKIASLVLSLIALTTLACSRLGTLADNASLAGPEFQVTSPAANSVLAGVTNVAGTCDPGAKITVTGSIVGLSASGACDGGGAFSIPITLTGSQGPKTLTITGQNAAGGISSKTHAVQMPKPSQRGLNLFVPCGNYAGQYYWKTQYDATGQNKLKIAWDLDYYKSLGLKLLRLNLQWEVIQPTLGQALTPWTMECTHYVLDQANQRGMKVILDLHNYGRYAVNNNGGASWSSGDEVLIGQPSVPTSSYTDVWTRLATEFNADAALFGYDLMNEPHDMNDDTLWPTLAQAATTAIRVVDTTTPIIVSGDHWSTPTDWRNSSNETLAVNDPRNNVIYQAHVYFDPYSAGQYAQGYDAGGVTETTGVDRARPFVEWLNEKGYRGLFGEFGVPEANNPAQTTGDPRYYATLDKFLNYVTANGVHATVWAGGYLWIDYGQPNSWYVLSPLDAPSMPTHPVDRGQMSILRRYPSHY